MFIEVRSSHKTIFPHCQRSPKYLQSLSFPSSLRPPRSLRLITRLVLSDLNFPAVLPSPVLSGSKLAKYPFATCKYPRANLIYTRDGRSQNNGPQPDILCFHRSTAVEHRRTLYK